MTPAVSNTKGASKDVHTVRTTGGRAWKAALTMTHIQDPKPLTSGRRALMDVATSAGLVTPLLPADRSCCCSAPPAFTVVVSRSLPKPHSVDLLMCGHHYRQSRVALAALGALVFASDGHLV